eukprot:m.117571 g.117571  ORF g.117571 m.117571 type:complete len:489 (-) comp28587_c1_seq1:409-1875(-)
MSNDENKGDGLTQVERHQIELARLTGLTPRPTDDDDDGTSHAEDQHPDDLQGVEYQRASSSQPVTVIKDEPKPQAEPTAMPEKKKRKLTEEEKKQRAALKADKKAALEAELEQKEKAEEIKIGAKKAYLLIIPVSITMMCVVALMKIVELDSDKQKSSFGYTPYEDPNKEHSTTQRLEGAALNSLIVLALIVCLTFGLVICYKAKCYRAIHGWLMLSTVMLVFWFSYEFLIELLQATNTPMSWPIVILSIWNFGVGGMFSVHWKSPLIIQQAYLIAVSTLMALCFLKYLPDWTTWFILALMAVYDLAAVLLPYGPLRMLVETAMKREEPLFPALIYSSSMVWMVTMADIDTSPNKKNRPPSVNSSSPTKLKKLETKLLEDGDHIEDGDVEKPVEEEEEFTGVKLGLGDFIFYSILVGKASMKSDWGVVVACYVCVVVGLVSTIFILCLYQKALPALPISIFLALTFYFTMKPTLSPFQEHMNNGMIMY